MKHLGVEINIDDKNVVVGSTEWLKKQIESSKFRFSCTADNEPCVVWDYFKMKNGEKVKAGSAIVAFIDSKVSDSHFWKSHTDECMIANSVFDGNHHAPSIFNYLTDNAKRHCDMLIVKLADALLSKVASDRTHLKINVTVE